LKSSLFQLCVAAACLAGIGAGAAALAERRGWTLYYGDAEAHLNIARRIVDSRTPGYSQIGTVWLPLPHVLMLPFVGNDGLWRSGMAGVIPSLACYVVAGLFLFAAARRLLESSAAAAATLALFALNPNLLYLSATPMTEPVLFASLMALLYFTVLFRQTQSRLAIVGAGLANLAATLTRYEGWFLIPFVALYFLAAAKRNKFAAAAGFGAIASLGPLYWIAHNWILFGNPLEFYNGPYSAKAIYQRTLDQSMPHYPGDHDWRNAWRYFWAGARLCAGGTAFVAAAAGLLALLWRRAAWPLALLALPPLFYILSLYSSATPMFVPTLWPNSYYNTRYGLAALPLLALCGGALILFAPRRWRAVAAAALIAGSLVPWVAKPDPANWICWKESQVNSETRRAWTREAAEYLGAHYVRGSGVFTSFGDLAGIYREAGIPFRETLNDSNGLFWTAATRRPDLFVHQEWAVAMAGDAVSTALQNAAPNTSARFDLLKSIILKNGPVIEIYRRGSAVKNER
jgi:hypothetical protein